MSPRGRLGAVTLVVAAALWTQLALLPLAVSAHATSRTDGLASLMAALAIGMAGLGVHLTATRPRVGSALLLAGFPTALGLVAVIAGRAPLARFDPAARLIAAATAVGYMACAVAWSQRLVPLFPVTVTPLENPPERQAPPPLRGVAMAFLAAMGMFLGVVAPLLVSAHGTLTRADRLGGIAMAHAREALTAAAGLTMALLVTLGAGSSLLRGRSARRRRTTRAVAYLVWGAALVGLGVVLNRLR